MNSYFKGTSVKCRMLFYSDAAKTTLADPTTITFRFRDPSGNLTTHVYGTDGALVKSATGDYYELINTDEEGVWEYEFEGTGTVDVVHHSKFRVEQTLA